MMTHDLDAWTWQLLHAGWNSLGNGTALVLLTAAVVALLGRRVPAGVQAALWTLALAKFVLPCGPSVIGSMSRGIQLAGDGGLEDLLWAHGTAEILWAKVVVCGI
jgi:hypothetical protein